MAKRVQSPSSINTYQQCPRKYYYIYIKKLKTIPTIHLVRGSIVHSVLEDFFRLDIDRLGSDDLCTADLMLRGLLTDFLQKKWDFSKSELDLLAMTEAQRLFYYEETEQMLLCWLTSLIKKLSREKMPFTQAFKKWLPRTEEEYISEKYMVKGYIDAIHEFDGEAELIDYKTSSKDAITPEYRLQLAIYALLYLDKHNRKPNRVGINFLKFGERMLDVDDELLSHAKHHIELIHANTESDEICDYPKKESGLCKWHSGQCDFYKYCF